MLALCQDSHGGKAINGPQLAFDGNPRTHWRPRTEMDNNGVACKKGEAWIGYDFGATPVRIAKASITGSLGVGLGGPPTWTGGVSLQSSDDASNWVKGLPPTCLLVTACFQSLTVGTTSSIPCCFLAEQAVYKGCEDEWMGKCCQMLTWGRIDDIILLWMICGLY